MKSGTLVMFEGQIGTVVFRKSSHYADVAVDFVPVNEGKVNGKGQYGACSRLFPCP